jgi:hypothetical protein
MAVLKLVPKLAARIVMRSSVILGVIVPPVPLVSIFLIIFFVVIIGLSWKVKAARVALGSLPRTSTASKVKGGTSGKATSTARESTGTAWKAASGTAEATAAEAALVTHHAEQDLGIDATHAAAHTPTAAKHVSGVEQIISVVITGFLPIRVVSNGDDFDEYGSTYSGSLSVS